MIDLLLRTGLSNLCLALGLGLVAWTVQRRFQRPRIAHLLWLLVLVKLLTPSLFDLPVIAVPTGKGTETTEVPVLAAALEGMPVVDLGEIELATTSTSPTITVYQVLAFAWLAGSLAVLSWSLVRIRRFHRLLLAASTPAPDDLTDQAHRLARRLGLRRCPSLRVTEARMSPMVWWAGGEVRVILPAEIVRDADPHQLRWILAHELGHVRRRDHLVRWIEWLACVACWWNPLAWWARHNLRINEEICCDHLVLETFQPRPRVYAGALVFVVEFLASPAIRPPAVASEINSGGALERRIDMILTKRILTTPRWLSAAVLLGALTLLPLGVAYAQDYEAVAQRLRAAVEAGELTGDQARVMMDALRKSAAEKERAAKAKQALAEAEVRMKKLVDAGMISSEDARRHLMELRRSLGIENPVLERKAYARTEAELKRLVEAGRISTEDARRRLARMRQDMGVQDLELARRDLAEAEARMKKLVEAGLMTPGDMTKRLAEMRRQLHLQQRSTDLMRKSRENYAQTEAKLKRAVDEGQISAGEAHHVLQLVREQIKAAEQDIQELERNMVKHRIEVAVKEGRMTREDADTKYRELREQEGKKKRAHDRERAFDWETAKKRIEGAVKAGEITREQADAKYREIEERLRKHEHAEKEKLEQEKKLMELRKKYADLEAELKDAVHAGKLTKEEAEKKLIELRKKLLGDK